MEEQIFVHYEPFLNGLEDKDVIVGQTQSSQHEFCPWPAPNQVLPAPAMFWGSASHPATLRAPQGLLVGSWWGQLSIRLTSLPPNKQFWRSPRTPRGTY